VLVDEEQFVEEALLPRLKPERLAGPASFRLDDPFFGELGYDLAVAPEKLAGCRWNGVRLNHPIKHLWGGLAAQLG
jgi:hypothetical protein